jgi:hypothetical protein
LPVSGEDHNPCFFGQVDSWEPFIAETDQKELPNYISVAMKTVWHKGFLQDKDGPRSNREEWKELEVMLAGEERETRWLPPPSRDEHQPGLFFVFRPWLSGQSFAQGRNRSLAGSGGAGRINFRYGDFLNNLVVTVLPVQPMQRLGMLPNFPEKERVEVVY